jgi:vitamin B12 transporter
VRAQAVATDALPLVIVTATRTPQRVDQALAEVTVIDRTRIDAATGRTLPELLAGEAGVQFWSNGGRGTSSAVALRGLEPRHTLLLIDGVRYGSATLGTPVWENLPLDSIERIEIVRGPLSGLYGSDAVGGVIQIFTRGGSSGFEPEAAATFGSRSYGEAGGGARFGVGAFDGAVRVQHLHSGGFSATNERVPFGSFNSDDDGFHQTSASARGGVKLGAWRAEASLFTSRGETQYDDGSGADSRAGLRSEVLAASAGGPIVGRWRTLARLSRATDEYETLASASAYSTLGTIATVQKQLSWENTVDTPLGTLLALAERLQQDVRRPGAPFAVSGRTITAAALGLNGGVGPHGWQANLRRDHNSQFGDQTTGSLAYGFDLIPSLRAAASFGTSFVAPSFNQLYYPDYGNPDLLPEKGRQSELSLRWSGRGVTARLAYFDNRIRGYISSGPLPTNVPRTHVDGFSVSADAVRGAWTIAASLDRINPLNDTEGATGFGRILPRRVRDSARLAVDWHRGSWSAGGMLAAFGERFDDAANTMRLGGYATLDLRVDWSIARDWALGVKLDNALDKRYETVFGYNQPGREAFLTLRYSAR